MLCIFDPCPAQVCASQRVLLKHNDVYYLQSSEQTHALLDVERYANRWPFAPQEGLRASSVQHPGKPKWRWLLHSCRVPVRAPVLLSPRRPLRVSLRQQI